MRIKCGSCGKVYDYDKDELCPKCGAHNQLPRAEGAAAAPSAETAEPQPRRGWQTYRQPKRAPGTPPPGWTTYTAPTTRQEKRSNRWKVAAGIFLFVLIMVGGGLVGGLSAYHAARERQERGAAAASAAASLVARAEREALAASLEALDEWEDWEVWDDWDDGQAPAAPAADGFFEDGADGSVPAEPFGGEDGAPAPGEGDAAGSEPFAAPAPDLSALASFTYGTEVGASKGVTLTVNSAGPAGSAGLESLLLPGEKAIFIDFTAEVTDADAFGREFFQPPFVRVGQDGGRSLWPYGADLPAPFTPLDVDGMRYTDRTVTTGQLFFAVPEDCHTFMLHYGDPDESYYIQRINV